MTLDAESCYRALQARDPRFDGVFYVGVTSTGIYCRPICPARTPMAPRCRFFRSGAQALGEGFRPCLRCRPDLAPGLAPTDASRALARRALGRIEAGALEGASVQALATELGVSERHLRRAVEAEVGVAPLALARAQSLARARQLLEGSRLPVAEIAHASGFQSVRRFQTAFREAFHLVPTALRRPASGGRETVRVRLAYRAPFDWASLQAFLSARAIPGVEASSADAFFRTAEIDGVRGWFGLHPTTKNELELELSVSLLPKLSAVVARVRALCDLDARPAAVAAVLKADPFLAPMVRARGGLRVPGTFDGFELATRAVLGQLVSVGQATRFATVLVDRFGAPLKSEGPHGLRRCFPSAAAIASKRAEQLGIRPSKARTLVLLARAVRRGAIRLEPGGEASALLELPGIGRWTAEYVAMRALRDPDAFPAEDLWLKRRLGSPSEARARAETWRPWRAYAALHLWTDAASALRNSKGATT